MKKFLLILLCGVCLTACQNQEDVFIKNPVIYDNVPMTEEMMEEANDLSLMQDKTMLEYKGGVSHRLDLDQDGTREEIFYEMGNFEEDYTYTSGILKINDIDYSSEIEDMFNISESFTIGKIGKQFFLMITSELDDDYIDTRIFIYEAGLKCVCASLEGSYQKMPFMYDDLLHTTRHTDVLGSDIIDVNYKWNGSEFIEVFPEDGLYSYDVYKGKKLKVLENLTVYENRDLEKEVVLPVGTEFTSDKTDGEYWSNVIVDNKEYWFFNDYSDWSFFDKIEGLFFAG